MYYETDPTGGDLFAINFLIFQYVNILRMLLLDNAIKGVHFFVHRLQDGLIRLKHIFD